MPVREQSKPSTRPRASAGVTCDGCEVTVSWMEGSERSGLPANWVRDKSGTFCLLCRRTKAADEALEDAPENASREQRAKMRANAVLEFEVLRDPERPNGEIAKACRASVPAVLRARERVGAVS
jgi:hypothetical protein